MATPIATESGHWYSRTGEPRYTVTGKNGKVRPTTLRDARELDLLPSVTTIIRLAAAPGLETWKARQLALACLTLPRLSDETEDAFLVRAEQDARAQGKAAAEHGERIHGAIERHYLGLPPDEDLWDHVKATVATVATICGSVEWSAEKSFACHAYGGKVDLHSPSGGWVIDFKTKDGPLPDALFADHYQQLAAYRNGLGLHNARCAIVYVRRDAPEARLVEAEEPELQRGMRMFNALLMYWHAKVGR